MLHYYDFNTKASTVVVNLEGKIELDNTLLQKKLELEIDYNSFDEETLKKIILDKKDLFNRITKCRTYTVENGETKELKAMFVPIYTNGEIDFKKILSENNDMNFSMITNEIEIYENDKMIMKLNNGFSKKLLFVLSDGDYDFKFLIKNLNNEVVYENIITVILKTNEYKLSNNKTKEIKMSFNEQEGNFDIKLSSESSKLYSFKIDNIDVKDKRIIDFTFYNKEDNNIIQRGKIGSKLNFLSQKQIDELEKYPELENYIKGEFVFNIQELLSPTSSKDDIGILRLPMMKEKVCDNFKYYYDLNCSIGNSKNINFSKDAKILITDKFKNTPLFYKFLIRKKFNKINIIDKNNDFVDDYIVEKISDNISIVYFQPLRENEYYYQLDQNVNIYKIDYKSSKLPFVMKITKEFEDQENPVFLANLMLYKADDKELGFEITFDDYSTRNILLKKCKNECDFLENERIKINKKIIALKCNKPNAKFELYNMIGNVKNNRTDLIFLKNNIDDFVYIAKEFKTINLKNIPEEEIAKMKVGKKYIYTTEFIEVNNGPLELKEPTLDEIIFTDIEEYRTEQGIAVTDSYILNGETDKEFFEENIKEVSMEVKYEN